LIRRATHRCSSNFFSEGHQTPTAAVRLDSADAARAHSIAVFPILADPDKNILQFT